MWKLNLLTVIYFISFSGRVVDSRVPSTLIISSGVPAKAKDEKSVKTLKLDLKRDNDDYIDTTKTKYVPFFPQFTGKTWKPEVFDHKTSENNENKPIISNGNKIIGNHQQFRRKAIARPDAGSDVSGEEIIKHEESKNAEKTTEAVSQTQTVSKRSTVPQQALEEDQKITPIIQPVKPSMKPSWLRSTTPLVKNITKRRRDTSFEPNKTNDSDRMEAVPRVVEDDDSIGAIDKEKFGPEGVFTDLSYAADSPERIVAEPEQLDMAVALGHRVEDMRNKNRLCDRNILLPEGPKYNSKGKVYLEEFEANEFKSFPNTVKPSLVLPKCCNCCRKSVLGCQ